MVLPSSEASKASQTSAHCGVSQSAVQRNKREVLEGEHEGEEGGASSAQPWKPNETAE